MIGTGSTGRSDALKVVQVGAGETSLPLSFGASGVAVNDSGATAGVVAVNPPAATNHAARNDTNGLQDLGTLGAGRQRFVIEAGKVPPGQYQYEVAVVGADGTPADVTTYSDGVVDSVQFEGGNLTVRAGNLSFTLDQIVEITSAASPSTTE